MKFLLFLALGLLAFVTPAQANCTIIGNQIFCDDGSSAFRIGNQAFDSNGGSALRLGNQIFITPGQRRRPSPAPLLLTPDQSPGYPQPTNPTDPWRW